MLYQTTIPAGCAEEQEFRSLIEQLSKMSGQRIEIEMQLSISTDSMELSAVLDNLADVLRDGKPTIIPVRANGHKKKKKADKAKTGAGVKPAPTRGPHVRSIKVNGSGEMISRFELDRRLAERVIEPGTELHSPKHGKMIVQQLESDQSLALFNELGEQL
jgi:hypothetical protein